MSLPLPRLQKAICLGRSDPLTIDVAVQDGPVQKLRCPTDQALPGCTSLGSRIWFSSEQTPQEEGVWELVEVDGGYLTCVNPARLHDVFLDAFKKGAIAELADYPELEPLSDSFFDARLWDAQHNQSVLVTILPVLLGDEIHRGFFPHDKSPHFAMILRELIKAKYKGEDVRLMMAVANNGIERVFVANHIDRQVGSLIHDCLDVGIPIIAKQVICSLENIKLGETLPFKVIS